MKKIVLFDMDGTLTPARKQMESNVLESLKTLYSKGYEIGIVSGSDFDYIKEQCKILFDSDLKKKIHWLPCNGTKYYSLEEGDSAKFEINMIQELGQEHYNKLIKFCIQSQLHILNQYPELPLTGNFFQYRGSMLNWCPIGRSANLHQREIWERLDKDNSIRLPLLCIARDEFIKLGLENLVINLGGETSFDIYPKGWDKTYSLRYFQQYQVFFIGDRCQINGNDHTIYEACRPNSWQTKNPEQTISIIENFY